jgi:hypothetical protein
MKTNILIAEEKEFVLEFSFSDKDPLHPNVSPPIDSDKPLNGKGKYVECFIYRREIQYLSDQDDLCFIEDEPYNYFYWKGILDFNNSVPFQLTYEDHIDIKGDMKIYQNGQTGLFYLWVDCKFGLNLTHYFMGDMAQIEVGK